MTYARLHSKLEEDPEKRLILLVLPVLQSSSCLCASRLLLSVTLSFLLQLPHCQDKPINIVPFLTDIYIQSSIFSQFSPQLSVLLTLKPLPGYEHLIPQTREGFQRSLIPLFQFGGLWLNSFAFLL